MANDLSVYQGNNRTIQVTVTDSDGAAYDLTGAALYFNVKKAETDAASVISKSSADAAEILIIVPATDGVFEVYLLPADSAGLESNYIYDITMVVGGETYTLEKARIDFNLPVK